MGIKNYKTFNKTRIIATVGPASETFEQIEQLALNGVDVFRLNFSHGTHENKKIIIDNIRKVNQKHSLTSAMLGDLQGPKIRIGRIENNHLEVISGDEIFFTNEDVLGTKENIYISYSGISNDVKMGDAILIDDGKIETKVLSIDKRAKKIKVKVIVGGIISSNKGLNLPNTNVGIDAITEKDRQDIDFAVENNLEWLALSFVQDPEDILQLKYLLSQKQSKMKVISKIEKPQALESTNKINEIINLSDAVMIARGDLGVEMPVEKIALIQKELITKCIHRARPVIVATQMMESMIDRMKPNRSEIIDVANAVREGADAVMLSGETATGKHPELVVSTMKKIILEVEQEDYHYNLENKLKAMPNSPSVLSDAICYNTCKIAADVDADLIVGMTQSGFTAMRLSSYRPRSPLVVFVTNEYLTNQLSLSWGIRTYYYDDHNQSIDVVYSEQIAFLKSRGYIKSGDVAVFTGSIPVKQNLPTNMIKVEKIP